MKKILALLSAAALVLCLSACGSKDKNKNNNTSSTASVTSSEINITATMTADEYLDALKPTLDNLKDQLKASGLNFECYFDTDNKTLVYSYTYAMQVDADAIKEFILQDTTNNGPTFQNSVNTIHKECPDIEHLRIVYKNADGSTLWSGEFNAQ